MPEALLHAYAAQVIPLRAEESILASNVAALGGGRLREDEARRLGSEWQRAARRWQPTPTRRPESRAELRAALTEAGVEMMSWPKNEAEILAMIERQHGG